jgi:hypothetical protein
LVSTTLVDVKPAGRVDDQDVSSLALGLSERPFRDVDRAALGSLLVDVRVRALAHRHELLHGRGALGIARHERDV